MLTGRSAAIHTPRTTPTTGERVTGSVVWFDDKKGYGFITPDAGGPDVFVTFKDIRRVNKAAFRTLGEADRVQFAMGTGRNSKPCALDVIVLEKHSPRDP